MWTYQARKWLLSGSEPVDRAEGLGRGIAGVDGNCAHHFFLAVMWTIEAGKWLLSGSEPVDAAEGLGRGIAGVARFVLIVVSSLSCGRLRQGNGYAGVIARRERHAAGRALSMSSLVWTNERGERSHGRCSCDRPRPAGAAGSKSGGSNQPSINRLSINVDRLPFGVDRFLIDVDRLSIDVDRLSIDVDRLSIDVDRLSIKIDRFRNAIDHCADRI